MNERDDTQDQEDDGRLAEHAGELFDESVLELDANTLSRLDRSRQRALAEANRSGAYTEWLRWTPAAAVAAAAVAAVIMWGLGNGIEQLPTETASDFEILLAEEELEMLEDLEFYRWMALDDSAEEPGPDDHVG